MGQRARRLFRGRNLTFDRRHILGLVNKHAQMLGDAVQSSFFVGQLVLLHIFIDRAVVFVALSGIASGDFDTDDCGGCIIIQLGRWEDTPVICEQLALIGKTDASELPENTFGRYVSRFLQFLPLFRQGLYNLGLFQILMPDHTRSFFAVARSDCGLCGVEVDKILPNKGSLFIC